MKMEDTGLYEYIKGIVTYISPYYVVIETQGIGYQIAVANPFAYGKSQEQQVKIYVYQVVREDAHTLYGFENLEEKQLFIKLISVSGIGPKSALAIMASADHAGLIQAIDATNVTYLTKFPGVGKKTAQQLILDLKGKLGEVGIAGEPKETMGTQLDLHAENEDVALNEALEALFALGYSEREIKKISKELAKEQLESTDAYLRHGLKLLMKK